ncbi:MAG: Ig-like domain repeat protein, partial [Candidatus Omnitrophica bacterium]|nr:Ig-like domain repeat protein [Candidatus Omnitrophota bacterium]
ATKSYTLPTGDGSKTIYVKYYDKAGNVSQVYSKSITLDTQAPTGTVKINSDQVYTNSASVTLTLTGSDLNSGLDQMRFTTDAGVTWTSWEAFNTTKSITLPTGDGTKTVVVQLKDKAGLVSNMFSDGIILDTTPPSGTIQVNGGAQYVTQTAATLNLSANDATSGLSQMSFSSDNVTYTTPQAYNTTKSWTFSTGDGNKTVWVKFKDLSGLWSNPVSVTVMLDTTIPTGSINVNSGATYTNTNSVTLNLSAQDGTGSGIDKMSFSTDNVSYSTPEAYSATKSYTLPTGDGSKTVYVKYFDKAGNASVIYSKSITLDTTSPTGTIKINNDAAYANSSNVTLNLTGTDATSGVDQMQFSTDGGANWTPLEAFSPAKSLTLPSGDGTKTVQYKLWDKAGNPNVFTDTITLDTALPTGSILINNGDPSTTNPIVTLTLTAVDSTSGIDQMRFSVDSGTTWSAWEPFAQTKSLTLASGSGTKTVQYQLKDKAQNISLILSDTIELQTAQLSSFSDDFNRTSIGSNWTLDRGAWSILNNELYHAPGSPDPRGNATLNVPLSSNDYDISASINFANVSRDRKGLVARFSDLNNYYYAEYTLYSGYTAYFDLYRVVGGATTRLASVSGFGISVGFNLLRLTVVGSNIKMFVNNVLKAEANDSSLTSGRVGVYSMENEIRVDNFTVNVVTPVVPLTANALPQYTNQSSITLSGTKPQNTSILINGVE